MMWVKADDFSPPDARLISRSTGSGLQDHDFMLSPFEKENPDSSGFNKVNGDTTTLYSEADVIYPGAWYHVAATYDGEYMRLFVDGEEVGVKQKTGLIESRAGLLTQVFDNPEGGPSDDLPLDGTIDDLKVFDRALDATRIQLESTIPVQ